MPARISRLVASSFVSACLLVNAAACGGGGGEGDKPVGPTPPPSPRAASLEFVSQPTKSFSDSTFRPAVRVMVKDQNGAAFTTPVQVTLALETAASGVSVANASATTGSDGTATFDNLQVTGAATGLAFRATIAGSTATSAVSNSFDVTPAPVIADSTKLRLVSDSAARAAGTYVFQTAAGAPTPRVGGVLVGGDGGGYLIKVKSVHASGATVTVQGDQAALTDAVRDGEMQTTTRSILSSSPRVLPGSTRITWGASRPSATAPTGITFDNGRLDFEDVVLWGTASKGLVLGGFLQLDPDLTLKAKVSGSSLESFTAELGGQATFEARLSFKASPGAGYKDSVEVFPHISKSFFAQIGWFPVYGRIEFIPWIVTEVHVGADIGMETKATASAGIKIGASYTATGGWTSAGTPTGGFTFEFPSPSVNGGASAKVGVRLQTVVYLYEVVGPYIWAKPHVSVNATADVVQNSWSTECKAAVELGVGVRARIFSYTLVDYNWYDDFLNTPITICNKNGQLVPGSTLSLVSGDGQTGAPGAPLSLPLVVRLTGSGGVGLANVPVSWKITSGGGSVSRTSVLTDVNGEASVAWTLGSAVGDQVVEASVAGATGSPRVFKATAVQQTTFSGLVVDHLTSLGVVDATVTFLCGTTTIPDVKTGVSGLFRSTPLPSGQCQGTIAKAGYDVLDIPPTSVQVGRDTYLGVFRLKQPQIGDLGGVVRESQTNALIPGATVDLWAGSTITGVPIATTATNASGMYKFLGLKAGTYTVRANKPLYATGAPVTKQVLAKLSNVQDLTLAKQDPGAITPADFVLILAGQFQMGSANGYSDERPVHTVTISKPFYLQKTEVTQAQWQAVMGFNPSYFSSCGPTCPVERVSWNEIQTFISRLNQSNPGVTYRLPTEAEWEYAARATTIGDYGGTGNLDDMGWYSGNSSNRTHPVAQKYPNAWGLYDMHGNVWEWVQDWYSSYYYSVSPAQDPPGPATGSYRVLRGGSWSFAAGLARSAYRTGSYPSSNGGDNGFRLARTQ